MSTPFTAPDRTASADQARWFDNHVRPHESALRAWLRTRFPACPDVDDLVQETYLRLFRAKDLAKIDHPKSYLFAVARNAALDLFRRNRQLPLEELEEWESLTVLEETPDASEALSRDQELELLTAAIRELPERCREVLILRKHHGLSHREIARKLGITENTVNAQITVGMMRCRQYFRDRGLTLARKP